MPGMWYYSARGGIGQIGPSTQDQGLASSTTFYGGDILVRTVISSNTVVRPLSAADITALYQDGSANVCGVYGLMPAPAVTNSSGLANSAPAFPGVNAATQNIYPVPSRAYGNAPDPVSGRSREGIEVIDGNTVTGGYLWENTTITDNLRGTAVGILRSTISGVVYYFWSSAATTKIGYIEEVTETDPYFNTAVTANTLNTTHNPRCAIGVRIIGSFQQAATLFSYAG